MAALSPHHIHRGITPRYEMTAVPEYDKEQPPGSSGLCQGVYFHCRRMRAVLQSHSCVYFDFVAAVFR